MKIKNIFLYVINMQVETRSQARKRRELQNSAPSNEECEVNQGSNFFSRMESGLVEPSSHSPSLSSSYSRPRSVGRSVRSRSRGRSKGIHTSADDGSADPSFSFASAVGRTPVFESHDQVEDLPDHHQDSVYGEEDRGYKCLFALEGTRQNFYFEFEFLVVTLALMYGFSFMVNDYYYSPKEYSGGMLFTMFPNGLWWNFGTFTFLSYVTIGFLHMAIAGVRWLQKDSYRFELFYAFCHFMISWRFLTFSSRLSIINKTDPYMMISLFFASHLLRLFIYGFQQTGLVKPGKTHRNEMLFV